MTLNVNATWFNLVHGHNLIYNTCWEDPRLDREALRIGHKDNILVITSAGCNALDYALDAPNHVYAVDVNYRQNALLDLKIAAIRTMNFEQFFSLFGTGRFQNLNGLYRDRMRHQLPARSRAFWDRKLKYFNGKGARKSFYFCGASGLVAHMINIYINRFRRLRSEVDALFAAPTLKAQQDHYYNSLHEEFWRGFLKWMIGQDATLSLLGVPKPQREQVDRYYQGGIVQFIQDCIETVFGQLSLADNYFWRVYLYGAYSQECCPEYLKKDNFERLKGGLVDRISTHTGTIQEFLDQHDGEISRYVLLDHMDWLSSYLKPSLEQEWQAIVHRAAPGTRLIWRSGGMKVDYVDPITVAYGGGRHRVGDLLTYHPQQAYELHKKDRVHTYGSFYIADLAQA